MLSTITVLSALHPAWSGFRPQPSSSWEKALFPLLVFPSHSFLSLALQTSYYFFVSSLFQLQFGVFPFFPLAPTSAESDIRVLLLSGPPFTPPTFAILFKLPSPGPRHPHTLLTIRVQRALRLQISVCGFSLLLSHRQHCSRLLRLLSNPPPRPCAGSATIQSSPRMSGVRSVLPTPSSLLCSAHASRSARWSCGAGGCGGHSTRP